VRISTHGAGCTTSGESHGALGAPAPVLPGLGALGAGFDAVYGTYALGSVFAYTFSNGHTLSNPFPAQAPQVSAYAVPDQVTATSTPSTTLAAQSAVVYSSLQAANLLAANVASGAMLPASGPFALSATVLTTSRSLQRPQTYSAVAVTQRTVTMYQAAVAWQAQTLDPNFVAAVNNLPGLYDPAAYSLFTQSYGTHVLVSGTFGGQAVDTASVNSPQGRPKSSSAIAQQALINFQYVTSGNTGPQPAEWFVGDSSGPSSFQVRKCTTSFLHAAHSGHVNSIDPLPPHTYTPFLSQDSFLGGNSKAPLVAWNSWVGSFSTNATLVADQTHLLTLVPLHQVVATLMSDTLLPSISRNLNASLAAYYASNPYAPDPTCSAQLICPAGQDDACCPISSTCCPDGCVAGIVNGEYVQVCAKLRRYRCEHAPCLPCLMGHRTRVHCAGAAVPSLVGQERVAVLLHKRAQLQTKHAAEPMCVPQARCAARALGSVLWTPATAVAVQSVPQPRCAARALGSVLWMPPTAVAVQSAIHPRRAAVAPAMMLTQAAAVATAGSLMGPLPSAVSTFATTLRVMNAVEATYARAAIATAMNVLLSCVASPSGGRCHCALRNSASR
jgi:hypothetical protein